MLEKVVEEVPAYEWLRDLKCKELFEYIVCEVLDRDLLPKLKKEDLTVYDTLKVSIIPGYERYKTRHPTHHVN